MVIVSLNRKTLAQAAHQLASVDVDLAPIYQLYGAPPLWARPASFATLVHIILEQQVSLASAKAAFERLGQHISVEPAALLRLDDPTLKRIGFSRQKAQYVRGLAQAVLEGFDIQALSRQSDAEVRAALIQHKGIGRWTAEVYLLMALGRPDVWPSGDLALQLALQRLKGLPTRPNPAQTERLAEGWRPWLSVAARMLWQSYLAGKLGP